MFENLRRAFREAVGNFQEELSRDDVPEAVDRLLGAMQKEAADAQADTHRLESDIEKALARAAREAAEALTCRRRERMAAEIGDEETAGVAREFAEKHGRRNEVLQHKATALKEELALKHSEVQEMLVKIKEAKAQRASLTASAGRTGARSAIGGAGDLMDELDRMAGKIQDSDQQRRAEEDFLSDFDSDPSDPSDPRGPGDPTQPDSPAAPDPMSVEERLAELKRRMGED